MVTISSRDNSIVKDIVRLHTPKGRSEAGQFLAEGMRTVSTLMQAGMDMERLYITHQAEKEYPLLLEHKNLIYVTNPVMEKMSTQTTPSGILGVFTLPKQPDWRQLTAGIVLARISDPGNMGTLIRTAAACKVKSVVIIDGVDVWSPKVIQATAGAIGFCTIFTCTWQELVTHKKNMPLYALEPENGVALSSIQDRQALLVIGSEAHGIPAAWLAQCDMRISIAMPGKTESLNAAIAGAIAMYSLFVSSN